MKKLPKVYQNEFEQKNNPNQKVYDSLKKENYKKDSNTKKARKKVMEGNSQQLSVKEKLKKLIGQNNYIFNTEVVLVFTDKEEKVKIAGIMNNHIITMDNQIIKIEDVIDLKIKN